MSSNSFGNKAISSIIECLKANSSLRNLVAHLNGVDSANAEAISKALISNRSIVSIGM
jgi:hypothetical protein